MRRLLALFFLLGAAGLSFAQTVTTVADLGRLSFGDGMTFGSDGALYVAGGFSTGVILRVALGSDVQSSTVSEYASGMSSAAGLWADAAGNLYTNDHINNAVLRIDDETTAHTVASGLDGPGGLVMTSTGDLIVSEYGAGVSGQGSRVSRVTAAGVVETYANQNGLIDPLGIAIDESDNVYVANWKDGTIFKITPSRQMTVLATAPATVNQMVYSDGALYLPAPTENNIYKVDLSGNVTLFAGTSTSGQTDGPALQARFAKPNATAVNAAGELFVLDSGSGKIRKISATTTGLDETSPRQATIAFNYPNPFSASTQFTYRLDRDSHVRLDVFDLLGRRVRTLVDGHRPAAEHQVVLAGDELLPGLYLYRLTAGNEVITGTVLKSDR